MSEGLNKEKLTKPRSPDQLDRAIRITSSRAWIATLLLAVIGVVALVWSVFGSLDTRVSGLGLVLPAGGKVFTSQAVNGGTVHEVTVKPGDEVKKGDILVVLRQDDDDLNIEAARSDLQALQEQEQTTISRANALIDERRKTTRELIASYNRKIGALSTRLREKQTTEKQLREDLNKGYVTRDEVDKALGDIDDLRFQIIDLREKIADAEVELAEFVGGQEATLTEKAWTVRKQEIETERLIEIEKKDEIIRAPADGLVSELDIAVGDKLTAGQLVVSVLSGEEVLSIESFFRASDGKRVRPGMRALVAVSSAEPAIYGTAIGEVVEVSRLPVTDAYIEDRIGNKDLVRDMMADGAPVHIRIRFLPDSTTVSGIAWSSFKGPPFKIDTGTFASPTITVASQPPINFVAPLLPERIGLSQERDQ